MRGPSFDPRDKPEGRQAQDTGGARDSGQGWSVWREAEGWASSGPLAGPDADFALAEVGPGAIYD